MGQRAHVSGVPATGDTSVCLCLCAFPKGTSVLCEYV